MKWQLPWKRKVNDPDVIEYDEMNEYNNTRGTSTQFVEPFRPLYDITDANYTEDHPVRPLYTPSSISSKYAHTQTDRISTSANLYPPRNRSPRPGIDRFPYRNGQRGFSGRSAEEENHSSIITYQWIGAIALVGALYLAFHSSSPLAARIQSAVSASMQKDYDLSKITAWVYNRLQPQSGTTPATALPNQAGANDTTITGLSDSSTSVVQTQQASTSDPSIQSKIGADSSYTVPLKNASISSDYKKDTQQEMILSGQPGETVQAVAAGTVAAIDQTQQQGKYVLIDHGKDGKTLYAHLGAVSVKLNAKVTQGQTIGSLDKNGKTADMYFGYIKNGKYEDPHSIVPFQ